MAFGLFFCTSMTEQRKNSFFFWVGWGGLIGRFCDFHNERDMSNMIFSARIMALNDGCIGITVVHPGLCVTIPSFMFAKWIHFILVLPC